MAIKKASVSFDDIEDVVVKPKKAAPPAAKKVAPAAKKVAPAADVPAVKRGFPARKPGNPRVSTMPPRGPALRFTSPSDHKPFFAMIHFRTGEDGLIAPEGLEIVRYRGRWDNENAKQFNMTEYDPQTVIAVFARLAAATYAPNVVRRLPPNTSWSVLTRVGRRAVDSSLLFAVKEARVTKDGDADGKQRWYKDKTHVIYRKLRRVVKQMPSAFVNVLLPPAGRQKKDSSED